MELSQYNIYLINLDPTLGSEMKKVRPCIIISPDEMNRHLQTVVIAPITNSSKPYPTRIALNDNSITGWIVLDQIRGVDKNRIVKYLGTLQITEIKQVKSVMKETYVD